MTSFSFSLFLLLIGRGWWSTGGQATGWCSWGLWHFLFHGFRKKVLLSAHKFLPGSSVTKTFFDLRRYTSYDGGLATNCLGVGAADLDWPFMTVTNMWHRALSTLRCIANSATVLVLDVFPESTGCAATGTSVVDDLGLSLLEYGVLVVVCACYAGLAAVLVAEFWTVYLVCILLPEGFLSLDWLVAK